MGKLVSLAFRENSAKYASPAQIIEEAAELVKEEWKEYSKMLIIPVNISDGGFEITYLNAGLKASQMLAIAAILNAKALEMMGHIPEE